MEEKIVARFLQSTTEVASCPPANYPEYAFIGRSNVGKSSLINAITQQKDLAKTSSKPGKTQTINHFMVNEKWYLVDLPGYGFARISQTEREKWQKMIRAYLKQRENLMCVFLLIDSRLEPQQADVDFLQWLGENQIPVALVFTKADKDGITKSQSRAAAFLRHIKQWWVAAPPNFLTSAERGLGMKELRHFITQSNSLFERPGELKIKLKAPQNLGK